MWKNLGRIPQNTALSSNKYINKYGAGHSVYIREDYSNCLRYRNVCIGMLRFDKFYITTSTSFIIEGEQLFDDDL